MHDLVFLVDFDNTLLDHDRFKIDLGLWFDANLPAFGQGRFWEIYEAVRKETDIVDLPEVVSRVAFELGSQELHRRLVSLTWDYPFRAAMLPGSIEALARLSSLGTPVILCDGHEAFQRHKLHVTGVAHLVAHNILVYAHKEQHAAEIRALFPARRYVMIDDKPRIHIAMKRAFGDAITTVLVRHGAYAASASAHSIPEIDYEIDTFAGLFDAISPAAAAR